MTVRKYTRVKTDTVLSLLAEVGPMTTSELAPLTGRTANSVRDSIRRLRDGGDVYIQAYQVQDTKGRRQPVYAAGVGFDAVEGSATSKQRNAVFRARNRSKIRAKNTVRRGSAVSVWAGLML